MSTAEILSLISTISYVIAAISFVLAVFLWFRFKIPQVFGELTGMTAKKSIAKMRAANEKNSNRDYMPGPADSGRGNQTGTKQNPRKTAADANKKPASNPKKKAPDKDAMPETGLLGENKVNAFDDEQTELLAPSEETELLVRSEETGMLVDEDGTAPLLDEEMPGMKRAGGKKLHMLDEVMLIHTNEVIR